MKPKEARCRFNKARRVYKDFNPVCNWGDMVFRKMPPHLFLQTHREVNCTRCPCFEDAGKE